MCTVTFVLKKAKVTASISQLQSNTRFLQSVLQPADRIAAKGIQEIQVLMPDWLKPKTLHTYLAYLTTLRLLPQDTSDGLELLELAILLEDTRCQEQLLRGDCFTSLSRNSCLAVLQLAAKHREESEDWRRLFSQAFELTSTHLPYLLDRQKSALSSLPPPLAEQLYRASLKLTFASVNTSQDAAVKGLKDANGVPSVVDLLMLETKQCTQKPLPDAQSITMEFREGVRDAAKTVFLDSLIIEVKCRIDRHLSCLYYSLLQRDDPLLTITFSVQLALSSAGSSADKQVLVELAHGVSKDYCFAPTIINQSDLVLTVRMRAEFALSAVSRNIAEHVDEPLVADRLSQLTAEQLLNVLRSPALRVASEDSILYILGRWCEEKSAEAAHVGEFLSVVSWEHVSLMCLLDCSRRFRRLKAHPDFSTALLQELALRSQVCTKSLQPQTKVKHFYKSPPVRTQPSYYTFVGDIAHMLPELDYTPKYLPEQDPCHNVTARKMQEQKVRLEKLRTHYKALVQRQEGPSIVSIVPCTTTRLKDTAECTPNAKSRKLSLLSAEETQRVELKDFPFLSLAPPALLSDAKSTDR